MLGITNSCSIIMGIAGNLATGLIVEATGSYRTVFVCTAALYLTSCAAFVALLRGRHLSLGVLLGGGGGGIGGLGKQPAKA